MLLLGVAGLLSAAALLAIGILLVGRLGETERRILGTTLLLAGYGLMGLPAAILLDQARLARLAGATLGLALVAASLATASVWTSAGDELGRWVGTATGFALASTQTTALAARRRERDPRVVRRLFALSAALAPAVAAMFTTLLWARIHQEGYARLLGALVVLDLLVVALQPILARARPVEALYRLRIVADPDQTFVMSVEAADLAAAAAKAIRALERDGRHVLRFEVLTPSRAAPGARAPS
jgi:hypothetical protein